MQQRRPGFPARLPSSAPQAKASANLPPQVRAAGVSAALAPAGQGLDSAAVRARMVQRLAAGGVSSGAVLTAMGAVECHRFVDSALVNQAYEDTSLPIGLGQTISKPSVVARMMELLLGAEIARSAAGLGRVLEVGTGCGYQAAVLTRPANDFVRQFFGRSELGVRLLSLRSVADYVRREERADGEALAEEMTLRDALSLFVARGCEVLPVVNTQGQPCGTLHFQDLLVEA